MVSLVVSARSATSSAGDTVSLNVTDVPRDLLTRVANNTPCVIQTASGLKLQLAHQVYARLVAEAVRTGGSGRDVDGTVALATPGWWTPRTLARVNRALADQDVQAALVNEAEATVVDYCQGENSLPETVAVVSLRSEQVSIVIVRNCAGTGAPLALTSPVGVHGDGGAYLDAVVLRHLVVGLANLGDSIRSEDPHTVAAAHDALRQCRAVREGLSSTVTESVLPDLPGATHRIRMVRSELEELAEPWAETVVALLRTVVAQVSVPVGAVIVTGGLSAMPLVSQRISANLGLEVHASSDPESAAARGAAQLLTMRQQRAPRRFALWKKRGKYKQSTPAVTNSVAPHIDHGAEFDDLISTIFDTPSRGEKQSSGGPAEEEIQHERLIGADDR